MPQSHSDTAVAAWLGKRVDRWKRLRELLSSQSDRADESLAEVNELAQGFRAVARDYSLASSVMPASRVSRQLEALLLDTHEAVYREPTNLKHEIVKLFREDVPQVVRRLRGCILATVALLVLGAVAGWLLVSSYPEMAALFVSEQMINKVQNGELWTDGILNVVPSSMLSLGIMTNNIFVALTAFAVGVFYGLGTLYIIGLNGLMLGGVFALTAQHNLAGKLFNFIIAHGVVELSVICLAGAAGLHLGEALARPGSRSRAEAFREEAGLAGKLIPVCALFLVGAGLIEGYISPNPIFNLTTRVTVGVAYGVLLWLVLSGWIWRPWARPVS